MEKMMKVRIPLMILCISVMSNVHAVDNTKIKPYGLYQTPDKTIWMRCSLGQTWTGTTCKGEAKEYGWNEAKKIANSFQYKGIKGWRLPTIKELHALIKCENGFSESITIPTKQGKRTKVKNLCIEGATPTIDKHIFPNTNAGLYWSATQDPIQNGFAWFTFFGGGHSHLYNMTAKNHVRLVKIPIKRKTNH